MDSLSIADDSAQLELSRFLQLCIVVSIDICCRNCLSNPWKIWQLIYSKVVSRFGNFHRKNSTVSDTNETNHNSVLCTYHPCCLCLCSARVWWIAGVWYRCVCVFSSAHPVWTDWEGLSSPFVTTTPRERSKSPCTEWREYVWWIWLFLNGWSLTLKSYSYYASKC